MSPGAKCHETIHHYFIQCKLILKSNRFQSVVPLTSSLTVNVMATARVDITNLPVLFQAGASFNVCSVTVLQTQALARSGFQSQSNQCNGDNQKDAS